MTAAPTPVAARRLAYRLARGTAHNLAGAYLRLVSDSVPNGRGRHLYLDPADHRARQLLLRRGVQDRPVVELWRRMVAAVGPTVALDVGCNYGEVVLSADYPPGCRIHCVEANPRVADLLRRSLDRSLPAAVLTVGAADRARGTVHFLADPTSSGLGRTSDLAEASTVEVPAVPCDDLLDVRPEDRLVFKIDVEGNEIRVLDGLAASLAGVSTACGIVEFYHLPREQQRALVEARSTYAIARDGGAFLRLDAHNLDEVFPAPGVVAAGHLKDVLLTAGRDEQALAGPLGLPA